MVPYQIFVLISKLKLTVNMMLVSQNAQFLLNFALTRLSNGSIPNIHFHIFVNWCLYHKMIHPHPSNYFLVRRCGNSRWKKSHPMLIFPSGNRPDARSNFFHAVFMHDHFYRRWTCVVSYSN